MRNLILAIFIGLLVFNLVGAEVQSIATQRVNNDVELKQIGADFTSCNVTSVSYPNTSIFLQDVLMTKRGNEYNFTIAGGNITTLGNYIVNGFCTNGSDDIVWAYDFEVSYTGDKVGLSNIIVVIVFLALSGLFLVLGYSFSTEHWILKSFFNFCAVIMGILAVNTAKIVASESLNIGKMANTGLTVMVIVLSVFFLYIFVYAFIESIKSFKEKRGVRWDYN